MIDLLKRIALRFQMRAISIHIDGCTECLECVADPMYRHRIEIARSRSRHTLAALQAEYNASLPLAKRPTWRLV